MIIFAIIQQTLPDWVLKVVLISMTTECDNMTSATGLRYPWKVCPVLLEFLLVVNCGARSPHTLIPQCFEETQHKCRKRQWKEKGKTITGKTIQGIIQPLQWWGKKPEVGDNRSCDGHFSSKDDTWRGNQARTSKVPSKHFLNWDHSNHLLSFWPSWVITYM